MNFYIPNPQNTSKPVIKYVLFFSLSSRFFQIKLSSLLISSYIFSIKSYKKTKQRY